MTKSQQAAAAAASYGGGPPAVALPFKYRRAPVVALHVVLVALSYWFAFVLRFDGALAAATVATYGATLLPLLTLRLGAFAFFDSYGGWWRYVGMRDMVALTKAVAMSSALFTGALFLTGRAAGYPRSVLIIDAILTLVLTGGVRFALGAPRQGRLPRRGPERWRRVLIIGAGDAGELLLREIHDNPRLGYIPVGFVDDDPRKVGFHIHGVPVLGRAIDLDEVLAAHPADELIIAIPSATREQIQCIVNRCLATKMPFRILPAVRALSGRALISLVRPVRVEDLLGRAPVCLDSSSIQREIAGRRVLITGAGGSIGAELARQVAEHAPAAIALLDRSESALFLMEQELRRRRPELDVRAFIGDVRERGDIERIFDEVQPELVYHAAAFKHVPMMESHLVHAVHNNVFGTRNIAERAAVCGAKLVFVSSDKAVAPSSVMGATKRLAEKLVLSLSVRGGHHFVAVRFGNVLGSNGSVVRLFSEQIADGGPLTVTHPEATRYFMTIPEAVQLVLQASALAEARGKTVMLEMGEPVRIVDLARSLIRLSGLEPDVDIPIVFTGLRPGEKLHEQLTADAEETVPTRYEQIHIVRTDGRKPLERGLEQLWDAVVARDERTILRRLQELVPEFSPQASLLASLRERAAGTEVRSVSRTAG